MVDSSIWIANLRDSACEAVRKLHAIEHGMRQFEVVRMLYDVLAVNAARNYRLQRRRAITVPKILTLLQEHSVSDTTFELLHDDRDLSPTAELLVLRIV